MELNKPFFWRPMSTPPPIDPKNFIAIWRESLESAFPAAAFLLPPRLKGAHRCRFILRKMPLSLFRRMSGNDDGGDPQFCLILSHFLLVSDFVWSFDYSAAAAAATIL